MKTKKIWRIAFMMLAAFSLASCKPSARQTTADAEQPTDSTETVTSADTLRLVIIDKSISRTDGHWQQVPFPKDFGFTSVLSTVAAHDTTTIYGHLAQFRLTPGHYRLCKPIAGKTLSDDFFIRSGVKFPTEIYR